MKSITKRVCGIEKYNDRVVKAVCKAIDSISHEPPVFTDVRGPCFVIDYKKLSSDNCLAPFYYDMSMQKEKLKELVQHDLGTFMSIVSLLINSLEKGGGCRVRIQGEPYRFNPDIVSGLKAVY